MEAHKNPNHKAETVNNRNRAQAHLAHEAIQEALENGQSFTSRQLESMATEIINGGPSRRRPTPQVEVVYDSTADGPIAIHHPRPLENYGAAADLHAELTSNTAKYQDPNYIYEGDHGDNEETDWLSGFNVKHRA